MSSRKNAPPFKLMKNLSVNPSRRISGNKNPPKAVVEQTALRHKLIIAVDYGTTFSGVAYVTSDKTTIDDISIITTWPGELSTSWKTPTRIAYESENRAFDGNKWGFEVEPKHLSYSWTKLLLDRHAAQGAFDDPSLALLVGDGLMSLPHNRAASGVCEDYLRELYKYVSEKLMRQMGAATFDLTPMEVWVTLPAIWSDGAKDATKQAAMRAGFASRVGDEIHTIAEPEAAAIATLKKYSEANAVNAVKPGENILICDCGGGTTDVTTYTINEVTPQLNFDELCIGVGGKCGATYIDRNLHALLSRRFGDHFNAVSLQQKGPGSRFMASFEKVKRTFGLNHDMSVREVYPLTMKAPDSVHYDSEERTVMLSYADMQEIFDPVVKEITKLVQHQVSEARSKKDAVINRIILVGGFGDSAYLNQQLATWCRLNGGIQLMCPENPQAAVVRGAALRGLESIAPRTKQARRHYGYGVALPFREGIDAERHSYLDDFDGTKYCSGRMKWAIMKGESIVRGTSRSFNLSSCYKPEQPLIVHLELYSSTLEFAPERHENSGVENVGRITARLPASFPFGAALTSNFNELQGKRTYEVALQVEVVFGNVGDNLTYRTLVNDTVAGTASIEFSSST